jgi:hypothetical protein
MENSLDPIDLFILETFQDDSDTVHNFASVREMSIHVFRMIRTHPYMKYKPLGEIQKVLREWLIRRRKACYILDRQYLITSHNEYLCEFVMRIDLKLKRKEKPMQEVTSLLHSNLTFLLHSVLVKVKIPLYQEMTFYHYVRFCIDMELKTLEASTLKEKTMLLNMLDTYLTMNDVMMLRFIIITQRANLIEVLKEEKSLCSFSVHLYESIYLPLLTRRFLTGDNGFYELNFLSQLPMPPFTFMKDDKFYQSDFLINNHLNLDDMMTNYLEK